MLRRKKPIANYYVINCFIHFKETDNKNKVTDE